MDLIPLIICPICGATSQLLEEVPTINPDSTELVELRFCDACGHWWHSPAPSQSDLDELYRSRSPYVVSQGAKGSYLKKDTLEAFHRFVLKRVKEAPGDYLEIGAGGGGLLRRFRALQYNCLGVDPSQWVNDSAILSSMDELPKDAQYDVFVLQDVLEHILDPISLLVALKHMARPDSILFCSFPCNDSRPARVRRGHWTMVRPYGHLHYFSRRSASAMLSYTGWHLSELALRRQFPLRQSIFRFRLKRIAYELIKGTKDQLYVMACSSGGTATNPASV